MLSGERCQWGKEGEEMEQEGGTFHVYAGPWSSNWISNSIPHAKEDAYNSRGSEHEIFYSHGK